MSLFFHRKTLALIFLIGSLFLFSLSISYAQGPGAEIRVNKVDVSSFPTIRIFTTPLNNGKVVPDLTQEDFRVYEDGALRPITEVGQTYVGTQVAIVLDASGSFKLPGVTDPNKRRYDEAIDAIDALVLDESHQWIDIENRRDWLMLMAPTTSTEFDVIQDWTNAYTAIHNAAFQSQPVDGNTPLLKMLQDAMKRMKDLDDYRARSKFLLVFSDGVDRISAQDITDVLNRAHGLGVTILSVKIGPANAGAAKNLQRLAEETDGAYAVYNGPDSLAPLYSLIQSQGYQYVVSYQSAIKTSGDHAGQLGVVRNGREYKSDLYSIPVSPLPPAVLIADPDTYQKDEPNPKLLDGKVIERVTDDWQADLKDIEPKGIPIPVIVSFPDGHRRDITEVLYEVNGNVVAKLPPTETFFWDFTKLDVGEHHFTLIVTVRDSIGLEGKSEPARVTVIVRKPEAPQNSVISGEMPGGAGDQLILTDKNGQPVSSVTVSQDGSYQFTGLPAGEYYIKNMSRERGVTEAGPVIVDGVNAVVVPGDVFGKEPIAPPPDPRQNIWFWIPWILALMALAFAVYVYIKRPQAVMAGLATVTTKVQEVTQPFRGRRGLQYRANASLLPIIDDMGNTGKPIPITAQSVRIGRDPAQAQIVFSDPTVSRYHARIVEESDGVFLLYDEGSTSGTYVNDMRVEHEPVRLAAGDLIEFGRVKVRFNPGPLDTEVTEPFLGR